MHLHRGQIPELGEVIGSDVFDAIKLLSFVQHHEPTPEGEELIDLLFKSEIQKFDKHVEGECEAVANSISELLDTLSVKYQEKRSQLQGETIAAAEAELERRKSR